MIRHARSRLGQSDTLKEDEVLAATHSNLHVSPAASTDINFDDDITSA